jgi:uncharacterized membrane protein
LLLALRTWDSNKNYIDNALRFLKPHISLILMILVVIVFLSLALARVVLLSIILEVSALSSRVR